MNTREYERRYQAYISRYRNIRVYRVLVDILGEMIGRCIAISESSREDTLAVRIPVDSRGRETPEYANRKVSEYIGFCDEKELDFWMYVMKAVLYGQTGVSELADYLITRFSELRAIIAGEAVNPVM